VALVHHGQQGSMQAPGLSRGFQHWKQISSGMHSSFAFEASTAAFFLHPLMLVAVMPAGF
jgi:hypothetical protein